MGPMYKVVSRPPFEKLLASWLNPQLRAEITCESEDHPYGAVTVGKNQWIFDVVVRSLHKPLQIGHSERQGDPVPLWFTGWGHFPHIGVAVAGCLAPRNRDSWIQPFASMEELAREWQSYLGEETEVSDVVRHCMAASDRMIGNPVVGAEICLVATNMLKEQQASAN